MNKRKARLWYRLLKKFYVIFYQKVIREDLATRKGKCHQCGECCKSIDCPLLYNIGETYYCKVHGTPMKPYSCVISPIRIDFKARKSSKTCGYSWDDTKCPKD